MAQFLGLGLTHYPPLATSDERMAGLLRWTLEDPDIPDEAKDPTTWPRPMQDEWQDPTASAERHRTALVDNLRKVRARLDAFDPDVVVVWGDDQYENFRETVIPPFAIMAYGDREAQPWQNEKAPNVWGEATEEAFLVRGRPDVAKHLVGGLIEREIDVSYAYEPNEQQLLPHAFMNTVLFLDWDRQGFPYPVIPFSVNCYGNRVISFRGSLSRFADRDRPLDPPGPLPRRCMAVGAAVVETLDETDLKVALVASASWSHAFLVDKTWRLHPTVEADREIYELMVQGDYDGLRETTPASIVENGQQELLNWFCLFGAMEQLGRTPDWSDFVSTHIFNSDKIFATYGAG